MNKLRQMYECMDEMENVRVEILDSDSDEGQDFIHQVCNYRIKCYKYVLKSLLEGIEMQFDQLYHLDKDFAQEWDFIVELLAKVNKVYFGK